MKTKSLRQTARELNVSPSYLSQVLHGKRPPSVKLLSNSSFKMLSDGRLDDAESKSYNSIVESNDVGQSRGGGIGRRRGLKILRCNNLVGSRPSPGTSGHIVLLDKKIIKFL